MNMSNYQTMTKRHDTEKFEMATWIDNYFGGHNYGVQFANDDGTTTTYRADQHTWEFEDAVTKPDPLVPGSERWNFLASIHFQAKHMESSDAIIFLNKYVKEEIV